MAKNNKNATTTKKPVKKPASNVQGVQTSTSASSVTETAPEQSKVTEKELPVQTKQGDSEQKNDTGNTQVDTINQETATGKKGSGTKAGKKTDALKENQNKTDGEKGSGTGASGTPPNEEGDLYNEAKEVIKEMVIGALEESGVLNEAKVKTAKRREIAIDVFGKNSNRNVLYFTSDLIPFFELSDAKRHADKQSDKTVVKVNKE